jgi:hypothetical protein
MSLVEVGLPWRVSRVCLGDAFVYGSPRRNPSCANDSVAWLVLASFMLTLWSAGYEC